MPAHVQRRLPVLVLVAAAWVSGSGCSQDAAHAAGPPPANGAWPLAERLRAEVAGIEVLRRHQCTRCHNVDWLPAVGRPYDCTSCHVWMKGLYPGNKTYDDLAKKWGKDIIDRYITHIKHLIKVPDLTAIGRRVRPEWIGTFLAAPEDLRPMFEESMIRTKLDAAEIRTLVRYFAAVADVPLGQPSTYTCPDHAVVARGRDRFVAAGCPTCHQLANLAFPITPAPEAAALAPNLRFARDRVPADTIVEWMMNPKGVTAGASMPKQNVTRADAELIRDFVECAPIELGPVPPEDPALVMPPAATGDVTWAQVKERVLGNVCVHCHMNDHEKDTGPGNGGGFGYKGTRLAMRTYEMLVRGSVSPVDGKRFSILEPAPGEQWPRILQAFVNRRVENRRDKVLPMDDHVRPDYTGALMGMPLGLPALTDADVGLVRRWIEEGCPGPTEVTGRPGITDGFLVPDGPVTKNQGCEVREPEEPPPAWASRPAKVHATPGP